ncbi:polymer-forming cytoskeletal protein [Nannocystis sp.]|uniref:bactofilin family protein n=1 Tax=Nannocystis sp. TaxID=1962667 RepID=UPI0024220BC6|nr:polymer-forming cytoskeletal protein [Nannocystis sp.]MBK7827334.1 polymer-forming cytoskeletal protein [Nannocystis sp.]MBK9754746.1 polymer-forming cytoskeletal protein [Nannocystis sp.]
MATKTRNNLPSPEASAEVIAHIGPGTRVVGRVSGQEDLRVHGTVEGTVRLAQTLFVEPEGVLLAEVFARDVVVSGTVVGNIHAESAVLLTASARVVGDIRSPRVSVEPGAAFRGAISMEPVDADELAAEATAARSYSRSDTRSASARGALAVGERPVAASNGDARRTPARQQAVRLPPRRAQAFTAAAPAPRTWTTPAPRRFDADPIPPIAAPIVVVQHPAIRSSDDRLRRRSEPLPAASEPSTDAKKLARPRTLPRGKHKVERVD